MNEELKTLLTELGIKPIGISKMEADGVIDEATLQTRINELQTIEACKADGSWIISKGAFSKLIAKFPPVAPAAPAAPDAFGALVAPLCKTTRLTPAELADKLADLGNPDELIEYFTDGTVTNDLLIQLFGASADELMKVKLAQGLKNINEAVEAAKPAAPAAPVTPADDPARELGENEKPSQAHMASFASANGMDLMSLMMFMSGSGGQMDLSGMIPIRTVVDGYNPRKRDMFLMIMGQIENRLGGKPIVVIDANGAINRDLTVQYIEELEEGYEHAEGAIYDGGDGVVHQLIKAGVDAQSIKDADPLNSRQALRANGVGIGRINWNSVDLEVKQVVFYAVQTGEIDPNNDAHMDWLREKVSEGVNRLALAGKAPQAITRFNEAARCGELPTLRVMLNSSPRRQEIMPRRRRSSPRDLSGLPTPERADF